MHLENGIANAGRTPKTTKKLSIVSKDDTFSSTQDVEDEDYDVVEIKKAPERPRSFKHPLTEDITDHCTIYDVPRRKMSFSQMLRKSRSTFSLDRRQSDTAEAEPRRQPQPPLPSPRKIFTAASSPASEDAPPPLPAKTPADVSRKLF